MDAEVGCLIPHTEKMNPFASLSFSPEEMPAVLRHFWMSLPDSALSVWDTEFRNSIDTRVDAIRKAEEELAAIRRGLREATDELGGAMWRAACRDWSEAEADFALKTLI